jgi:3-amino-4-hydroxybenzoic acid synthase
MTTAWIDLRNCQAEKLGEIVEAAIANNIEGVVFDEETKTKLGAPRPEIKWISILESANGGIKAPVDADTVVHQHDGLGFELTTAAARNDHRSGILIDVRDKDTLNNACAAVRAGMLTVVHFKDPTKIPLEIVLAAGAKRGPKVMTFVSNLEDAKIVMSVLESGPDGVIMTPRSVADVVGLGRTCSPRKGHLELKEFEVTEVINAGRGDRVCVDTCSNFAPDEGILIGSFGGGFLLCCSETHPLPYMKTRPFRVNAGSVNSYVLSSADQTNYLSELRQGDPVIGVRVGGETRELVVGRAKIETRPLILVKARTADGEQASIVLQNDWHVRVLGPKGVVLNVTELTPGSIVVGHVGSKARHVGMPIDEYCLEQ